MDGKNGLNPMTWDFTDSRHSESMLKPTLGVSLSDINATGYQPGFLKATEHHSEASSINFIWVPQRNFLHPAKTINHLHTTPVTSEIINVPSMPITSNSLTVLESPIDAKPINARKLPSSAHINMANCVATKVLRTKESKKQASSGPKKKGDSISTGKREKTIQADIFNDVMMDLSGVPAPFCSCTGMPRQCYRWGTGGWQSSCCTTRLSEYPLPVSPTRPGARMAGRKMSIGAYTKLIHRLAAGGHDLSYAVDLKNHWARHGTNKFVTIK